MLTLGMIGLRSSFRTAGPAARLHDGDALLAERALSGREMLERHGEQRPERLRQARAAAAIDDRTHSDNLGTMLLHDLRHLARRAARGHDVLDHEHTL